MEKLVYLLNSPVDGGATRPDRFSEAAVHDLADKLHRCGAYRIVVNVADLNEPVHSAAPGRIFGPAWPALDAVVEFWLDNLDRRRKIELLLAAHCEQFEGYLVTESIVQNFAREWPPKTRRPGVTQFTALAKPAVVVLQDLLPSPALPHATFVLPGGSFAEREGAFVNHAGLAQELRRSIRSPGEARPDGRILWELAGRKGLFQAAAVRRELAETIPAFAAMVRIESLSRNRRACELLMPGSCKCSRARAAVSTSNSSSPTTRSIDREPATFVTART